MAFDFLPVLAHVLFGIQHLFQSDVGGVVYRLGRSVHQSKRHAVHARHVLYGALCLHRAQRQYLAHLFTSVLSHDVIYHFPAALVTKVHVKVGRGNTLRVQKSFKKQLIFERVHVCYAYGVSYYTAHAAAAPRAHGNALAFRVMNKIPHDKVIFGKAGLDYYPQLIFRSFAYFVRNNSVTLFQPLVSQPAQIFRRRGTVLRAEGRHKVLARYIDVALVRNLRRGGDGFRYPRKQLFHLFRRFDVKLVGFKPHS